MSAPHQRFLRQPNTGTAVMNVSNDGGDYAGLFDLGGLSSLGFDSSSTSFFQASRPRQSEFMQSYGQWYFSYFGEQLKLPRFNKGDMDLEQLWFAVKVRGGSSQVSLHKQWAEVGRLFDPPASMTNLSYNIKRIYEKYLLAYEKAVSPQTAMDWRNTPINRSLIDENTGSNFEEVAGHTNYIPNNSSSSPRSPPHKRQAHDITAASSTLKTQVDSLNGSMIRIFLADKGAYFPAIVTGFDSQQYIHTIRLHDGTIRDVKLADCVWQQLLPSNNVVNQQQNNGREANSLSSNCPPNVNQVRQFLLSNRMGLGTTPAEFSTPRVVHSDKEEEQQRSQQEAVKIVNQDENSKLNSAPDQSAPAEEEKSQNMASSFAPLVYKLQTQLQTALAKVKQLEAREEQRAQEMQQMHVAYVNKERQLHALVSDMRAQLREALEGKKSAEGAVAELRNCFSLLVSTQGIPASNGLAFL
eukprot:TRINITY_DN2840_c0_g1_i1.p2 TRINITY_DN2840_c0_g1~~TRINITY_DN2840_c0_g1_i1.p2  ORF type:complete len:541 (+),score=54.21 TRINITY_DN2840_c0_g1_i1:220-1623(+)